MTALLSPAQARSLWAIVNRPGNFPNAYPGGVRSVRALERRGLVRRDRVVTAGVEGDAIYPTAPGFRLGLEIKRAS